MRVYKLRLKNFLSIRDIDLELGKLNVFVGPNSSGKSNIVRALQLLSNHARVGVPVLPGYRDFKSVVHGFDPTKQIELEIEAEINGRSVEYILALTPDSYIEIASTDGEEVLFSSGGYFQARVLARGGRDKIVFNKEPYTPTSERSFIRCSFKSALISLPREAAEEVRLLAELLEGFAIHSFDPRYIRLTSRVADEPSLGYEGGRLARVLLHLYLENRETFAEIEGVLRSLIPEVEQVILHIEGESVELWLRVKHLREPLKPANISDGTLRMLAYITVLHSGTTLAAFEEPENFVHPHLLETLVNLARKAPCQVIMTTHSPYLLDHVKPEEVYVVEKPGVETIVKKLSETKEVEAVKKLLEEGGTLGEAWYSGIMGGVPRS